MKKKTKEKKLDRLLDSVADDILRLTPEELLGEVRSLGLDPQTEAERTRRLLRKVLRSSKIDPSD